MCRLGYHRNGILLEEMAAEMDENLLSEPSTSFASQLPVHDQTRKKSKKKLQKPSSNDENPSGSNIKKAKKAKKPKLQPQPKEEVEILEIEKFISEPTSEAQTAVPQTKDFITVALDEIALEGLDGITIEALWTRFCNTMGQFPPLLQSTKRHIWNIVRTKEDLEFFTLPTPRETLVVVDRFKQYHPDEESPILSEPYHDIYPFVPIKDKDNAIRGSCSTYYDRVNVTKEINELTLEEATERFKNHLVIVASQNLRYKALISEYIFPPIIKYLHDTQYIILERIARSRRIGEVTCGEHSLQAICKDAKTLFYYRKFLLENQLISKQPFYFRSANKLNNKGHLFHLQRFHHVRKSRKQVVMEQIIKILLTRPFYRMEYLELRKLIGVDNWEKLSVAKILKSAEFKQFVKTDLNLLYREMYPLAVIDEWKWKACNKEKTVRIIQLNNPNININSLWKDDDLKESSSDDEPLCELSHNMSLCKQGYDIILDSGLNGIYMRELQSKLGIDFYLTRSITKSLIRVGLVLTGMVDAGRQRYSKFYAKCLKEPIEEAEPIIKPFTIEEPTEQDAREFLSESWQVNWQLESRMEPPIAPKPKLFNFTGNYSLIKEIRVKNIIIDSMEKFKMKNLEQSHQDTQNDEDREIVEEIYANKHDYIDYQNSIDAKLITRSKLPSTNENIRKICSGILNLKLKSSHANLYLEKSKPNKKSLVDLKMENEIKQEIYKVVTVRRIRKFLPIISKLFTKRPNLLAKTYKTYLAVYKNLMIAINADIKSNKTAPDGILSSDDDDEDCDSLDGNLENGESSSVIEKVGDDVKKTIIDNFDGDYGFVEKLTDSFVSDFIIQSDKKRPREESLITEDSQDQHINKKAKTEPEENEIASDVNPVSERMEIFMGPKPVCIYKHLDEDGVNTKLILSTSPEDFVGLKPLVQTERVVSRSNLIKDIVQKHKLVSDLAKMHQIVAKADRKQGYVVSVDRKSLFRIYASLVKKNDIKIVKIVTQFENITRSKNLIVCPQVDVRTILQSTIDQFKMSFFIYAKRKVVLQQYQEEDKNKLPETIANDKQVETEEEAATKQEFESKLRYKYSRTIGRTYGFYPKIAKMRVLHEFMYYMLYEYSGEPISKEELPQILSSHYDSVDDQLINECSTLYRRDISWKSFIPPLPSHKNWPNGWTLICDALLRLPISIFVKIFNVTYVIPELPKQYLNHPVKKHFLVKNLPPDTRDAVLNYRKYIFAIHEVFCHLCYLGIVQFGPQKFREKDQVFVYLNRKAVLYDTTSSGSGYHHITKKEYPKLMYNFHSSKDVEKYWEDMFSISMKTKLGQRSSVLGKYITLETIHRKESMIDTLRPQTPDSAQEKDVGYLPGDGLGACGVDSALWVHVKRNWIWSSKKTTVSTLPPSHILSGLRKKHMDEVKQIKFSEYIKQNKNKVKYKTNTQTIPIRKRKIGHKSGGAMTYKNKAILRKVKPRKQMPKRMRVDHIDKTILAKMGKSRASFCDEEDHVILICKAVVDYLCPKQRKRTVVHSAVRDFIHRILPYSRKTSLAYKRRCVQLKKSDNLNDKKQPLDFSLGSDYFTQRHFKHMREKLVDSRNTIGEIELSLAFLYLAYFSYQRYKASPRTKKPDEVIFKDYLKESDLHKYYNVTSFEEDECVYPKVASEEDIIVDTIKSVIHSSLGCKNASSEWPYQLLKIYQSFSESALRNALSTMRDQQLISGKKATTKHSGGREGSVLMCGFSYHLSFAYTFKQITKYPNYIFSEAHELLTGVHEMLSCIKADGKSIENFEQGHGVSLSELATKWTVQFIFDLPDDIISLDPNVHDHKDLVKELALRYKRLMYKKNQDNDDEAANDDSEISKRLEFIVENVLKSHYDKRDIEPDEEIEFDVAEERTLLPRAISSDDTFGINSDRRQKGVRISDLAFLLTKGLFPELDDDDRLEKLNKHFIVRYPTCKFSIDDEAMPENTIYKICHEDVVQISGQCLDKVQRSAIINNALPGEEDVSNALFAKGASVQDRLRADEIINFCFLKNLLGATGEELKLHFSVKIGNMSLVEILEILIDVKIILRVGICNFTFVHFNYRHNWSVYLDTNQHQNFQKDCIGYRLKVSPWIKIDSTVHCDVLYNWLNIVLSHCLSYPVAPFTSICKRFCYVKPVDIYQLLEFLQGLACLQIMVYSDCVESNLFSEPCTLKSGLATIVDNFADIFVEVDSMAMTKFGAFIDKDKSNFNFPFED